MPGKKNKLHKKILLFCKSMINKEKMNAKGR
jgi:hypothetical protein